MNIVVILEEDSAKQIVSTTRYLTGLTAPTNESRTVAIVWSDSDNMGGAPSGLTQVYEEGQRFEQGAQVQLQPSGENEIDLSAYYGTVEPGMVGAPSDTMGGADKLVTTVGHDAAGWLASTFAQPTVNSTVTVNLIDSTPFSGVSVGTRILADGCLYTLEAGSDFAAPGTLVLKNLGLGGARLTLTA